jgi:hypothetical protein
MLGGMLYFVARDVPEWKKPAAVPAGVVRAVSFAKM